MRDRVLILFLVLALATTGTSQPAIGDAEVRRGIALVDDGEYDQAILALDGAVRRLAAEKGHSTPDLAEAYFYLGVAYLGKGHETSAKARFRDAVRQSRDMSPSAEKFPPRVMELFEKAREESRAEMPSDRPSTTTAATAGEAPKKKGGKGLLLLGGVVVVGGGVALAAGGGGGGGGSAATTQPSAQQTRTETSTVRDQEQRFFQFTPSRAGILEANVSWQDRGVALTVDCAETNPPYTQCPGNFTRTTDTTGRFTSPVTQKEYLLVVSNYSGRPGIEPFTIILRYP